MRLFAFVASLCAMLLFSGCTMLTSGSASERVIVQVATMKVIEGGADRAERAARVQTIAAEARSWLNGENVTVAFLKQAAQVRIGKLNLQPSDQLLANLLVDSVVQDLQAKVGDGVIPPDKLISVNAVLTWVSDAAAFYL